MNKIYILVLIGFFPFIVSSCGQPQNEATAALRQELAQINEQLPITAAFASLTKMEIKGNDYIVYGTIDEGQIDFDEYLTNMKQNKEGLFSLVASRHEGFADLFVDSGLNLKCIFLGKPSMRKDELVLTAEEIKWAYGVVDEQTAKRFLVSYVASQQKKLPHPIEGGGTATACIIDGNYLLSEYQTEESSFIDKLREIKSEGNAMEIYLLDVLINSGDPTDFRILKALTACKMGWKVVYVCSKTSKFVTFIMEPELIESKLNLN